MFIKRQHINLFLWILAMFAGILSLVSCKEEAVERDIEEIHPTLRVNAQLAEMLYSRGYEAGPVKSGVYYLSYPNSANSGSYSIGNVNFAYQDVTPGIGIVILPNNEELTWSSVEGNQPTFFLDNVVPDLDVNEGADPMQVVFGNENNPFVAGVYDTENGKNDLLWGSKSVNFNTKTINFDLHHNMARLKVNVTVDETFASEGELSLEGATVYITQLQLTPESYNRNDGTLSLPGNDYQPLYLVGGGYEIEWGESVNINEEGNESNITIYTTQDFVLPPQVLLEDGDNRPRLFIRLQTGREFTGVIPYAMYVNDNEYPENYPMTLSFLKEHILTISTRISNNPPTLEFMPVLLAEWVDKGNFSLDAHQAGIYTANEFYDLIKYYNSSEDIRNYHLPHYGVYTETDKGYSWVFNLWYTITLDYSKIAGRMVPDNSLPNFSFNFNGFSVYVNYPNGTQMKVDAQTLYDILTGTTTSP